MNKLLPWTIASVAILGLVCQHLYWKAEWNTAHEAQVKASALYADSLTTSRDSVRDINARLVLSDTTIARIRRARDLAQASRPPIQEQQAQHAAHFDRHGINTAVDSLDLPPVGF